MTPNGKTILLAEDDPFISRMYETKLSKVGYVVTVVVDGRSALEHIQNQTPNLVILDLNIPELSGFDVIRNLINGGYNMERTKIIVLTNSSSSKDESTANSLGATFMIKAEVTPQMVVDYIAQLLSKQTNVS